LADDPAQPPDEPDESSPPRSRTRNATVRRGQRTGAPYVRVGRFRRVLRSVRPGRFRATIEADRPTSRAGRWRQRAERLLFGAPLSSEAEHGERLPKWKALAVFASDALSSSAYATEEILLVLVLAGSGHLDLALPIAIAISLLLVIVVISYRQTVRAYPNGGGSYSVSRENLGNGAGLVAAASLLTDYILTVAVSISAGALAVISAFPEMEPFRIELAVAGVLMITLINLRGVRESGTIFAIPTYLFIAAFSSLLLVGAARLATGLEGATLGAERSAAEQGGAVETLGLLLLLRAFASGATALTGVEAIANGVMAFRAPESRNASVTMAWMGGLLAVFFIGATFLATQLDVIPTHDESVLSQIGRQVFGGFEPGYYFLQATTALVLFLAANTAFNDFPRLASILARDGYMPRRFAFIGDRLTFSVGIVVLGVVSAIVIVGFNAETHRLIPLYAVGVFIAFTLSQSGMLVHWRRSQERGWQRSAMINGLGAVATGIVAVIVGFSKFTHGAWAILILVPVLVLLLRAIHTHYEGAARHLYLDPETIRLAPRRSDLPQLPVVVPLRELDRASMRAIEYARGLSSTATAVHIARELHEDVDGFVATWQRMIPDVPLVVIESPYRTFAGPFMAYLDTIPPPHSGHITVVVAEVRPAHWWQQLLHNRTGDQVEEMTRDRTDIVVTRVTESLHTAGS